MSKILEINKIHNMSCLKGLKLIDDNSIDCCVTSPPYYGLRDYGVDGQIGLEKTPEEYVEKLVNVFREVRRVLKPDGTLWLNLGDSYWNKRSTNGLSWNGKLDKRKNYSLRSGGINHKYLKPKDLIGIPWKVAFALQEDGWYLRSDIIWSKPSCMPESVKDRPTKSHEYIFLLSKSSRYYYDNEAIKEETVSRDNIIRNRDSTKLNNTKGRTRMGGLKTNNYEYRNKRSVWTVSTEPFKGAHFAVFPPKLIEPCILAGTKLGGGSFRPFYGKWDYSEGSVTEQ